MAELKYGNHVAKHSLEPDVFGKKIQIVGERDFKSNFSLILLRVDGPVLMEEVPHSHDFDMYLTLVGFNPNGLEDLGAEIEMSLGKEQEKYVINTPTSFYIPKGFTHCPLRFTRVDRPVLLVHSSLAPKYMKKE